jgi:hypothetical protein
MALLITATVGSATANSFITLVEYAAHMDGRLHASAFQAADEEDRKKSLIEATRELSVLPWVGERTDDVQALAWPRDDALNPDAPLDVLGNVVDYDDDEIPDRIKRATSELAFEFLRAGTTDIASIDPGLNVKRRKVDVIEIEFVDVQDRAHRLARFPTVMREIMVLLAGGARSNEVVRT